MVKVFKSQFQVKIFLRIFLWLIVLCGSFFLVLLYLSLSFFENTLLGHAVEMANQGMNNMFIKNSQEILSNSFQNLKIRIALSIGVAVLFCIFLTVYISGRLAKNLKTLVDFSNEIKSGNLDARVEMVSDDEFKVLADSFNETLVSLKKKQSEILAEKTLMESIVMNLTTGIVMFDGGGRVSIINKTAEKILMVEASSVLGQNVKSLPLTGNLLRVYELMGRSIEEGWLDEHLSVWQEKKTRIYPIKASSVVDKDGNFLGFIAIIKDI